MTRHKFDPNSSRRYGLEKKWWYGQIVLWTALFVAARPLFDQVWQLYVVVLSIYALGITADGAEEAAKAREHVEEAEEENDAGAA